MAITKERIVETEGVETKKTAVMVDVQDRKEKGLPPEVENWMQKMEKQGGSNLQQISDDKGQVVLTKVGDDDDDEDKVKLPVSRKTFSTGFALAVNKAGRWLSEFLFRLIKIKKGKVEFKKDES